MELSHKRARFELEKAASDSARDLEVQDIHVFINGYMSEYMVVVRTSSMQKKVNWCIVIISPCCFLMYCIGHCLNDKRILTLIEVITVYRHHLERPPPPSTEHRSNSMSKTKTFN